MALAPRRDLLGVPSRSISALSIFDCSNGSRFNTHSAISVSICSTARKTPRPEYLDGSPSLSSTASRLPVEAPEGTAVLPIEPSDKTTTAFTVGLPRESITS